MLQGIRLIKYYAWEAFYSHQIGVLREREITAIRKTKYVAIPLVVYLLTRRR